MAQPRNLQAVVQLGAPIVSAAAGALTVLVVLYLVFGSFTAFMLRLDPVNALGSCRRENTVEFACDFAIHYYPQGRQLMESPSAVPGFYYPGFFALCMRALASLPYAAARIIWEIVVVGSEAILLLAPVFFGLARRPAAYLAYGVLFASALPVLHDFAYGQVTSLLMALTLVSLLAYERKRRYLSAVLLGLAAAIKLYPALFAVHYLVRRDWRALLTFVAATLALLIGVPVLALGATASGALHQSILLNIAGAAPFVTGTAYSNFVANAVTHAATGAIEPRSWLYLGARAFGLAVAVFHVHLMRRGVSSEHDAVAAPLVLGAVTIPFVVLASWMHYFVLLPLLQLYVFTLPSRRTTGAGLALLCRAGAVISAFLIGPVLFLLIPNPDEYYRGGLPFWATCALLPALYAYYLQVPRTATGP